MATATADLERLSRLFQAFADETRLQIVQRLCGGECCVCDLQDSLGSYQSRLSFHLKKLKEAGIVDDRREGRWVYYVLNPDALQEIRSFLAVVETECRCEPGTAEGCCN